MPSIKNPTAAKVLLASAAMFSALAKVLATPFANANPQEGLVLLSIVSFVILVSIWRS